MTRISPNKRKSMAEGTPGAGTPKKQKTDPQLAKTPAKTPKSAKKGKQMENGSVTPQTTPKTNMPPKTPNTGKKGKKPMNADKSVVTPQQNTPGQTPKSGKKGKKGKNQANASPKNLQTAPKTPNPGKKPVENGEDATEGAETPKSAVKGGKKGGKLQKFEGTKTLNTVTGGVSIPKEKFAGLNKRQKKRLVAKLKKKHILAVVKSGKALPSVAQKTTAELTETNQAKKNNKKNKKNTNILNKSLEGETTVTVGEGKKRNRRNNQKNQTAEVKSASDSDESDYEVETQIKPAKVTKTMNEGDDSDEEVEVEEADSDDEDEEEVEIPKKQKKSQPELRDLNDSGIVAKGQSRYVLYVNNLPYEATKQTITEHFAKTCPLKDVRIPTDNVTKKPKGFAYIEVADEDSYQKALSVHHSFMNGRRINVQYTKPGAKNSPDKKQDIKKKNMKLQGMRQKGMLAGSPQDSQKRSARRAKQKSFGKGEAE